MLMLKRKACGEVFPGIYVPEGSTADFTLFSLLVCSPLAHLLLWLCDFYMFDLVWIKQDTFFLAAFHRVAPPTPPDAIAVYLDLEDQ
jgi:hypothetical protein